ncbi:MAG: Methyltransferase type 12 [Parcubacteria group bacterium GW2011_GWA1_47_10]|uniref:Methyltransferase type 12 n=1 Tax=Candidatus Nomurabacteria bacterium GW2011_GWB1_47_6 TaxID=1618749 RepID=A0A0G1T1C2_9BACT|nr:MAG: Methyltransferase type 12 [Parcubacteria group bacterium GW2011_GWA1_47_10]KKU75542.1 MAG: Methyltransferase type 12 [Candidatus Nomurabacteria bacterium GW2011_GWB1_47_6]OHA39450.1 MAG: hypothetical protein A3I98_02730 [Candidatus Taylorbacteria bacterium RIFCSPLOWO2_02_FULL_45_10b]
MDSQAHFDRIAKQYDGWKKKNWYYYQNLKALYAGLIPPSSRVWEIGCGTGDLLASLHPSEGLGTDVSTEMIAIARSKYQAAPNLKFITEDQFTPLSPLGDFTGPLSNYDFIFMADVLEHIADPNAFFNNLNSKTSSGQHLIVSVANALWEPLLLVAEKLKLKMPEGPHKRLSIPATEKLFTQYNWKIEERGYRLLIPKKVPGADFINKKFHRSKLLAPLGFIVYWELVRE